MNNTTEIVFVYLGNKLPGYARASLQLASSNSGLNVCIIGNGAIQQSISQLPVRFVAIEDFYDSKSFKLAATRVLADHSFRGGFWLKSLERLFVLHQYMVFYGEPRIFHAELDQLFFQICRLTSSLDLLELSGIFVPFHNEKSAVASVFYINDLNALGSLLDFAASDYFYPNEMFLLAEWGRRYPNKIFELPTPATYFKNRTESVVLDAKLLTIHQTGGLVDAAQVGQWVAGIDPKNLDIGVKPKNKFVDAPGQFLLGPEELNRIKFKLGPVSDLLISSDSYGRELALFNLHIHSKIHSSVRKDKITLENLFASVNSNEVLTIPGTRFQQLQGWLQMWGSKMIQEPERVLSAGISRINKHFRLRLSSRPFLSGDSFRAIADLVWEMDSTFHKSQVSRGNIVFCESEFLEDLNQKVLKMLDVPIVLVLGNSDRNFKKGDFSKIDLILGSSVFAQNLMEEVPGVIPLPIGLENRWRAKNGKTLAFRRLKRLLNVRRNEIIWGFSISTNLEERSKAALALMRTTCSRSLGSISSTQHRIQLSQAKFVASPPGHGIDTHRAWEAMYLGCVPILLNSYLSNYFKEIKLPVWVVDSYDELIELSETRLDKKYTEVLADSDFSELEFETWERRIIRSSQQTSNFNLN